MQTVDIALAGLGCGRSGSRLNSVAHWPMIARSAAFNGQLGRRPRERGDVRLFIETLDWLDALPRGVRPLQLPVDFIRITNELMRLWNHPVVLDRYFFEKETDRRGGRVGFPLLVGEELKALHVYSVQRRLGAA